MVKISLIGAGSVVWSMLVIRDLSLAKDLSGSKVALMDINEKRLNMSYDLASKYIKEVGANLKIEKTLDRSKALDGADFVINAVKVDGYKFMEEERGIAEKHGYYRGVDDRVSDYYGGFAAYRQLHFFLDLAKDIAELNPNAWYLQVANPVFEGTTIVHRYGGVKAVGFCDGSLAYKKIMKVLGIDEKEVAVQIAGFNHCIWLTKFLYKGKNAYPLIDEWIEKKSEEYWRSDEYFAQPWNDQMSRAAVEMYKLYGLFPVGDTTRSVSPWWFHTDLKTKERWFAAGGPDSEVGWTMYLNRLNERANEIRRAYKEPDLKITQAFPPQKSQEALIPFIESVVTGKESKLILNVPNNGSIEGLPDDVAVEIPVTVNDKGVSNEKIGNLPPRIMIHVMMPRWQRMEAILQAFRDGDKKGLLLWLMEDHRTKTFEQANDLIDDLLSQEWNSQLKEHYKE